MGDLFSALADWAVSGQGGPDKVFGTKPQVADFVPVDLSAETGKALDTNLGSYDKITALLDKISPGFSDNLQQAQKNISSELQGQIPQDVIDQIQRSDAFKSLAGGFAGSNMSHALTARDLGLTSLNLQQTGSNAAQLWSGIAEGAYSPWEVSTGQQASTTAANNAGVQAQQQYQYNVDAAPDPGAAGTFALQTQLGFTAASFGLGAAGGAIANSGRGSSSGVQQLPQYNVSGTQSGSPYAYNWTTNPTWGHG